MTYDAGFYDRISEGSITSAQVIVPHFIALIHPTSVVDVGCGRGWFLSEFVKLGITDVLGVDFAPAEGITIGHDRYVQADLREPLPVDRTFDLALCLETAEHLPESAADGLVSELCRLAPVVLFSAAIPMQGGEGHINERWPDYWIPKFESHRFGASGWPRLELWDDDRIEFWYRQNMLLFVHDDHPSDALRVYVDRAPAFSLWRIVHPELFGAKLGVTFR